MLTVEVAQVSGPGLGDHWLGSLRGAVARKAALYVASWATFALFFFSKDLVQAGFWLGGAVVRPLLASYVTQAMTWVLLTPVVLWLGRRLPIEGSRRGLHSIVHSWLSILLASLVALAVVFVAPRAGVTPGEVDQPHSFARLLMYKTGFFQDLLAYWVVFCLQYASNYHLKFRERERRAAQLQVDEADLRAQLARAELNRLRIRLQPQLVFDTLDATVALVRTDQHDQAENLLAALGDLLRCALDDLHPRIVSLSREFHHARAYLTVEQSRLVGRVHQVLLPDFATLDAAVMHGTVQSIVQRALELTLRQPTTSCTVTIRSAHVRDTLTVDVECTTLEAHVSIYPELEPTLENTRARLHQVYGTNFAVSASHTDRSTGVRLVFPYSTITDGGLPIPREWVSASPADSDR